MDVLLYRQQNSLWNVLTALRGPDYRDDRDHSDKAASTALLRYAVFGLGNVSNFAMLASEDDSYPHIRKTMAPTHFRQHAEKAFRALGLNWDDVNMHLTNKGL